MASNLLSDILGPVRRRLWPARDVGRKRKSPLKKLLLHEPRPLIHIPEGFGVFWSAKSASKAITYWFLSRQDLIEQAGNFPGRPHRFRSEVARKMPHHNEWLAACDPLAMDWLRIIRNPYRRAVSSYRHALGHDYEDERLHQVMGISLADRGLAFDEFLDYLLMIDIAACNKHHAQQWHPLEAHVALRRVINLDKEDLLEGLETFEKVIGAKPLSPDAKRRMLEELARDSARYTKPLSCDPGVHVATRFTRAQALGSWPNYDAFLTSDTRRKIEQIYAKDFQAYAAFL
jgi:hypothetical protein